MRKLLTVVLAVILAVVLAMGVNFYRRNGSFQNLSWAGFFGLEDNSRPQIPDQNPPDDNDEDFVDEVRVDPNMDYEGHIEKGDYYFDLGFLDFAANEYAAATTKEPESIEGHFKLMQTNYALRDYTSALNNSGVILSLQPDHFETKLLKARSHIKLAELDEAFSLLQSMSSGESTDSWVLYNMGLIKASLRENQEARDLFNRANDSTQDPELKEKLTFFLNSFAEYDFAQSTDEDYLYTLIARAFNQAEEYQLAIEVLTETLQTRLDFRDAWISFGFAYLNLEQYQFALTAFERAYQLDPQWSATQYFLGLNHKGLGNQDEAIVFFNYALDNQFKPELAVHTHLADLYFEKREYAKAVESYEKILEMSNSDVDAFIRPVHLHLEFLNQPEKALALAQIALGNFPESAMAHNLLGWSLIGTGDYDQAEESLLTALELDPDLAAAKYNLGNLYKAQNLINQALEAYQQAYEIDQNGSIGTLAAQAYNKLLNQNEPGDEEENSQDEQENE